MDYKDLKTTNIKAYFRIIGDDFNPEYISNLLGLIPDESWRSGDAWKQDRTRTFSLWCLGTPYEETLYVEDQVKKMLNQIEQKKEVLKKIKSEWDLNYTCEIVINIEANQTPAIVIDTDLIEFAHYVGAEIDIDTYIF